MACFSKDSKNHSGEVSRRWDAPDDDLEPELCDYHWELRQAQERLAKKLPISQVRKMTLEQIYKEINYRVPKTDLEILKEEVAALKKEVAALKQARS